jgi:hypothetical protein
MAPWVLPAIGAGVGAFGGLLGRDSRETIQNVSGGNNRSESSFTPWSGASPLYGMAAGIGNQMGQTPVPFFPGMGYVGPSGPTQSGVNAGMEAMPYYQQAAEAGAMGAPLYGLAAGQALGAQPHMGDVLGAAGGNYGFLSGAADLANNPYVQGMLEANRGEVEDKLLRDTLPSIAGAAGGAGMLGSSADALMRGQALGDAATGLSRTNASTMLNAYGQGLGAQQNALGQTGNMLANLQAPAQSTAWAAGLGGTAGDQLGRSGDFMNQAGQTGLGYGQVVEGYQDQALGDATARFGHQYEEPWMRMGNIGNAIGLLSPLGVQNTSGQSTNTGVNANPGYQTPIAAFGQGALAGGSIGLGMHRQGLFGGGPASPYLATMQQNPQNFGNFNAYMPWYGS